MLPLTEFDPAPTAILNPIPYRLLRPAPRRAVLCFFLDVLEDLRAKGRLEEIGNLSSELGPNPLYVFAAPDGEEVLVVHPGVGAPLAGCYLEEIIALGCERITACGGCGALQADLTAGHLVILDAAVRDEGTSFHYLPPSREVAAEPRGVEAFRRACAEVELPYLVGKAWTTDGIYRETVARRAKRIEEGCVVVEMEASAFFAVAQFRGVPFGQAVYAGDLVVPEGWDHRGWQTRTDIRERIFDLSVRAVQVME